MIRREQIRLKRMFQRVLMLSLVGPGALEACSASSPSSGGTGADSGMTGADSSNQADSVAAETGNEATSCQPSDPYYDDASYAYFPPDSGNLARCYYFVDYPCGVPNSGTSGCYLYLKDCVNICTLDGGFIDCRYWADAGCEDGAVTAVEGGPATIACGVCNGVGRRPAGLRRAPGRRTRDPLGRYFAEAAHLEAASVLAFERLRDELLAHRAPPELVGAAARSAQDEVRHARVTRRLARRFGGEPATVRARARRARSLEAMAIENAAEGCVRETFGALLATWQAVHAEDALVRAAMKRISADETRHAALAWAIHGWLQGRLDRTGRARVERARRAAVRGLLGDLGAEMPAETRRAAGLPSAHEARQLASAMFEATA